MISLAKIISSFKKFIEVEGSLLLTDFEVNFNVVLKVSEFTPLFCKFSA